MPRLRYSSPFHSRRFAKRRSPLLLFLLLLFWSAILGLGLAQVTNAQVVTAQTTPVEEIPAPTETTPAEPPTGTIDVIPQRYQLGQQLYLENCASCHVGLPPAVMPTQTWAALLQDSQHYGAQITPPVEPYLKIIWNYVSTYSRPIIQRERVPFRLEKSRYFKALHPKVTFTEPITASSCIACHPGAQQFNYRNLTPEWQNAP